MLIAVLYRFVWDNKLHLLMRLLLLREVPFKLTKQKIYTITNRTIILDSMRVALGILTLFSLIFDSIVLSSVLL